MLYEHQFGLNPGEDEKPPNPGPNGPDEPPPDNPSGLLRPIPLSV